MHSPWIDASDYGATGSTFTSEGTMHAGSDELELRDIGDFKPGQWITAQGCFYHTYGMLYNQAAPYLGKNQRKLDGEIEIDGLDNADDHLIFIIHFFADNLFSWMAVDARYQTKLKTIPVIRKDWIWQGEKIPVTDKGFDLLGGVRIRFRKTDWRRGESISFHVRNRLLAKISGVRGNTLELDRKANCTCMLSRVKHEDNAALQTALDAAIAEKKSLFIPTGHYRLTDGLWIRNASVRIEGAGRVHTLLDVSEANTACFWIAGGREVTICKLGMTGHTGFLDLASNSSWTTATGFAFWPTANQQMEVRGCAAINAVSTQHMLFEDLDISRMASEAIYLHGSDRTGKPPYIQHEFEEFTGLDKQYQKTCIIHRCNGYDCAFNLFNNNDFAEDTIISECRAEHVGNFCENASEFSRFTNNHVIDGSAITICARGNAVVSGNVFEGGITGGGISVSAGNVIIENNIFKNYSKESPLWLFGEGPIIVRGNLIDLTPSGNNPSHVREAMVISAKNVMVSDNHIEGGGQSDTGGFQITPSANRLFLHDNLISGCDFGMRYAERTWNAAAGIWEWHPATPEGKKIIQRDNQFHHCKEDIKDK